MFEIGLWDNRHFDRVPTIALVKRAELDDFKEGIRSGLVLPPRRAYVATANASGQEQYVLYYLETKLEHLGVEAGLGAVRSFSVVWEALIESLNSWNPVVAEQCIRILKAHNPKLFVNFRTLLDLIESFVSNVSHPLRQGLYYPSAQADELYWWKVRASKLEAQLGNYSRALEAKTDPDLLPAAQLLLAHTAKVRKVVSECGSLPPDQSMYQFAAFLMGLSRQLINEKLFSLVILTTHHALDLFLQSVAYSEGFLTYTRDGLRYRTSAVPPTRKVHLMSTEFVLLKESRLTPNEWRLAFLKWLNNTRNASLYTHSVYSCSQHEAESALSGARKLANRLEGHEKLWRISYDFFPELDLANSLLFDTEPAFFTYVDELETAELRGI